MGTMLRRVFYFTLGLLALFGNLVMFTWIGLLSGLFVFIITIAKVLNEYLVGQQRVSGFTVRLISEDVENS
jgi:hypothetical protein